MAPLRHHAEGGASQDEEDGPAVQGPMLPGEMAKMSKLFDDPDKLNLVRRAVSQSKPASRTEITLRPWRMAGSRQRHHEEHCNSKLVSVDAALRRAGGCRRGY